MLKRIDDDNNILMLSGPVMILLILIVWALLLWIGWSFIFMAFPGGLVNTVSTQPLETIDYFYYSGYVIFTLGSGEFTPVSSTLKLLSVFSSGLGVVFLHLVCLI